MPKVDLAAIVETGRTVYPPPFDADVANAHYSINESDAACRFLAVGCDHEKVCHYPDIDLLAERHRPLPPQ